MVPSATIGMLFPDMDEQTFKERAERLEAVNAVITRMDEAIRAQAFALLKPYISGGTVNDDDETEDNEDNNGEIKPRRDGGAFDVEKLVEEHESDNEADNVYLCLAIFYARHGRAPFAMPQLKAIAQEVGLAIPDRHDNTIRTAKRDGKAVVRKGADGTWKITPGGEAFLKEQYTVTKGRDPVPATT